MRLDFFKQQETIKLSNKLLQSIEAGYDDNKLRALLDERHSNTNR